MNFIITGIAIAYISVSGFGLIKLLLKDNIPLSIFGIVPLSFGAGLGTLAVLCSCIMILGLKTSFMTIYPPLAIPFIYALTHINYRIKTDAGIVIRTIKGISWKEWLLIFVILFGALSVFFLSVDFPLHFWDSRAIWGSNAKLLYFNGTAFSPDYRDMSRIHALGHPLLFPISQASIYFALGQADDWAVMLLIGLFFPFMVSFLYDLARIYLQDREKALAAAALLAVLPVFFMSDGPAYSGYADTPLSMLYCLSFGVALLWKKNKDFGYLLLSAFMTGLLFLTKFEGINLIALNVLLMVLPDRFNFNIQIIIDSLRNLAIYLMVIVLIASLGLPFFDATGGGVGNIINNLQKAPILVSFTFNAFLGIQKNMMNQGFLWGILWTIFFITTMISIFFRFLYCTYLSLIVLAYFIIINMIYIINPWEISAGLMVSNFFRFYQAVNPIVALQIVATIKALESMNPLHKEKQVR